MFCRECGKVISDNVKACPYCGKEVIPLNEKKYYVSDKNRMIALLLSMLGFIGLGGFQRVYVAKYTSGAIFLLTGGLFGLGTLWDLYSILSERFKDGDGFPLYSNSSMRDNYIRRSVKSESTQKAVLSSLCVLPLIIWFTLSMISFREKVIKVRQQETQINLSQGERTIGLHK
jgi:hypothetical protein